MLLQTPSSLPLARANHPQSPIRNRNFVPPCTRRMNHESIERDSDRLSSFVVVVVLLSRSYSNCPNVNIKN